MLNTCKTAVLRLFYILFALTFIWLTAHITVNGGWYYYEQTELGLGLAVALALIVLVCVWQLIVHFETALACRAGLITAAFLACMGAVQLIFALRLRYKPVFDIDAIFGGACQWAETGSFPSYYDYYYRFANNFGGLRFMYHILRLADMLGVRDKYLAASIANGAMSLGTMYVTGQVAKKHLGVRGQMMAYALFALSPPFFFLAPAFYTDALSMPFPILTWWLWLIAKERPRRRDRLILYALMGISVSLGAQIKATVLIVFIAIVLEGIWQGQWKRTTAIALIGTVVLLAGQAGLEHAIFRHLDRARSEQERVPVLHWVMMGLEGNGMYNPTDYAFTESFVDRDAQAAAIKQEIKNRIRNLGPEGLIRHLGQKGVILFGDGTYGLSDCLGGEPLTESRLREWALPGGTYNGIYKHICTGVLLAVYLLLIAAALHDGLRPDEGMLIPRLAVFGLVLFLLFWEARWRYFSNFIPIIFLCALPGLDAVGRSKIGPL